MSTATSSASVERQVAKSFVKGAAKFHLDAPAVDKNGHTGSVVNSGCQISTIPV